ncbi:MAG: hypothetical protein ACXIUB_04265 [Wenzhouxiangella sp.]
MKRRAPANPPLTIQYRQVFILPSRFGWMLGLLMFAMLMGSLNFNNNLGLLTTFIVAGLALNSMLMAYHNLRGLRLLHCTAKPVHAGDTARFIVTLSDQDGRSRPALEIRGADGLTGFDLDGTRLETVDIPVRTAHRGWLSPGRLRIQTSYPIGLFEAWAWFWPVERVLVWPKPAEQPPPLPRGTGDDGGRQTSRQNDSDNFHSLRSWRPEDPLHRIAWKASQRHQALLAREFRAEVSEHVVLDLATAPASGLEEGISVLTAWVLQAHQEGIDWTLRLGNESIGPDRGEAHLNACLRALAEFGQ